MRSPGWRGSTLGSVIESRSVDVLGKLGAIVPGSSDNPPTRVAEDLPGRVEALHLGLVPGHVGVEDLGEDAIGSLDHQLVRRGIHLEHAIQIGA